MDFAGKHISCVPSDVLQSLWLFDVIGGGANQKKLGKVGKGVKTTSHGQGHGIQQSHSWFEKTLALCHFRENDFPRGQVFTEMTKCKCFLEPGMELLDSQEFHSWFEKTLALCHFRENDFSRIPGIASNVTKTMVWWISGVKSMESRKSLKTYV